jgi:hypothetical protein
MKSNALGVKQPNAVKGSVILPAEPKPNMRPRNVFGEPVNDPVTGSVIIPKEFPLNKLPTSLRKRKATRKNRKNRKASRKNARKY